MKSRNTLFSKIGVTGGNKIKIDDFEFNLTKIGDIYFNKFKDILGQ